ncbi:hypothetical protein HMPREF1548_02821, partial [Clostridium sp. KLE 1755]
MADAAVAAVINSVWFQVLRDFEYSLFIKEQGPQVILELEGGAAALILFKLFPAFFQICPVFQGFHMEFRAFFLTGGAIAAHGENIGLFFHNYINQPGDFVHIGFRYGGHDGTIHTRPADAADFFQGNVEGAGLAEAVVGFPQSIQGKLVLTAAIIVEPAADFIIKMEGVSQNGEGDFMLFQQFQQSPEIRVQNGVASGYVKIRGAGQLSAHIQAVVQHLFHIAIGHLSQLFTAVFRKYIAVPAPLIAVVCYVPLKGEIRVHSVFLRYVGWLLWSGYLWRRCGVGLVRARTGFYLSGADAPQGKLQAPNGCSGSEVPQVELQAPGGYSGSEVPQAVPHALGFFSGSVVPQ